MVVKRKKSGKQIKGSTTKNLRKLWGKLKKKHYNLTTNSVSRLRSWTIKPLVERGEAEVRGRGKEQQIKPDELWVKAKSIMWDREQLNGSTSWRSTPRMKMRLNETIDKRENRSTHEPKQLQMAHWEKQCMLGRLAWTKPVHNEEKQMGEKLSAHALSHTHGKLSVFHSSFRNPGLWTDQGTFRCVCRTRSEQ